MKPFYTLLTLSIISFAATAQSFLPPVVQWSKCFGGTKDEKANSIIRTKDLGYIIVGTSWSNDGNVSDHHGLTDSSDGWVVKLDQIGNLQWAKSYGGSRNDNLSDIIEVNDGYVLVGSTESVDGDVTGLHTAVVAGQTVTNADAWTIKIDKNGNLVWSKCYGGIMADHANVIKRAIGGGFIVGADAMSSDGDLSTNTGDADAWVFTIDDNGALQWKLSFGDPNGQYSADILVTHDGNYFLVGYQTNKGYPAQLPGREATGISEGFYAKIDNAGNLLWNQLIPFTPGSTGAYGFYSNVVQMPSDRFAMFGYFGNTSTEQLLLEQMVDNIGNIQGRNNLLSPSNYTPYYHGYFYGPHAVQQLSDSSILACYSTNGLPTRGGASIFRFNVGNEHNPIYLNNYGGYGTGGRTLTDIFTGLAPSNDYEFVAAGYTNSPPSGPFSPSDITNNNGGYDFWVVGFRANNLIKGVVYGDYNSNGTRDSNEPLLDYVNVKSQKGSTFSSSQTLNGAFVNVVDTGTYTTTVLSPLPYYTIVPASKVSNFTSYNSTDSSLVFALQPIPGKRDYSINLFTPNVPRIGYNQTFTIQVFNKGTDTLVNRQVIYIKDSHTNFIGATPTPASINGDTIMWTISSLLPRDISKFTININLPPANIKRFDTLAHSAYVDSTGDIVPSDNVAHFKQVATASYDPNGIEESHAGVLLKADYDAGQQLLYTIHFQNTGTDTAFNIVLKDTLSNKFDSSSIETVSSSAPVQFTTSNGRYLTWTFSNILLVDSAQNEPASHGYVTYRVKPKTNLNVGDSIKNAASIYFDFNLPVPTNKETTVISNSLALSTPVVDSILATYCGNSGIKKGKILNLPSNASGISVTAKLDATTLSIAADSTISFDLTGLSGPHSINVTFSNGIDSKSTSDNFTVMAAVTPDVNIASNITSVIDATPITLTASNAAGGGSTPLYEFAIDRNFISIQQAESPVNTLDIFPGALVAGDNWFYVRMTTSTSCYTSLYAIDSIKLTKILAPAQPALTGLTATYCSNAGMQKGKITNLPLNGIGITVQVKLDANTLTVEADSSFNVDPGTLAAGPHNINITYTNLAGTKSTAFNFSITTTVTPDVNVSANLTNVTNLVNPVIITAANAAGGGTAPLYTFAADRAFTNLWKAESSSDTLHITPSRLAVGDNWIYVRMKTNATCYTTQTNIDSIDIRRDQSTGIVDVDDPSRIINIYPNPFRDRFTIDGLNPGKIYTVAIYNLQGQLILQQKVTNKSTIEVPGLKPSSSVYWLSIYDDRKQRLIGTVKLLKQ